MTPDDIRNHLFTVVRLRRGYDQAEVDGALDLCEAVLEHLTGQSAGSSGAGARVLTAEEERAVAATLDAPDGDRFSRVVLREGYAIPDVDDFMTRVGTALADARRGRRST